MCFTAVKDKDLEKLNKGRTRTPIRKVKNLELFKPSFGLSAFNHDYLPVMRTDGELDFHSWGFIQPTKFDDKDSAEIKFMTANAKAETIFEKKLYSKAILERRCIIFIDGFYEWRHEFGKKYPHFIYPKNDSAFFIGGIWNEFKNSETGEIKQTVSMITTEANPMMAIIHNSKKRMPLIFNPENALDWISCSLSQNEIIEMMKPYDENNMSFHTVGKKINSSLKESIQEIKYADLNNIQGELF